MHEPGAWVLELLFTGAPVDGGEICEALRKTFARVILEAPHPDAPRLARVVVRAERPFSLHNARGVVWTGAWPLSIHLGDDFHFVQDFLFAKGRRYDVRLAMKSSSREEIRALLLRAGLRAIGPVVVLAQKIRPSSVYGTLSDILAHVEALRDVDGFHQGLLEAAHEAGESP